MADTTQNEFNPSYQYPSSNKLYITGSRSDIRVGVREISLSDTQHAEGTATPNAPLRIYDTSDPYTDSDIAVSVTQGLAGIRSTWIEEREHTELTDRSPTRQKRIQAIFRQCYQQNIFHV